MDINQEIASLNMLLTQLGEAKWKLHTIYSEIDAVRVLQKYAGMGSLNDLYICQVNGHDIHEDDEYHVNVKIRAHLDNIRSFCIEFNNRC